MSTSEEEVIHSRMAPDLLVPEANFASDAPISVPSEVEGAEQSTSLAGEGRGTGIQLTGLWVTWEGCHFSGWEGLTVPP